EDRADRQQEREQHGQRARALATGLADQRLLQEHVTAAAEPFWRAVAGRQDVAGAPPRPPGWGRLPSRRPRRRPPPGGRSRQAGPETPQPCSCSGPGRFSSACASSQPAQASTAAALWTPQRGQCHAQRQLPSARAFIVLDYAPAERYSASRAPDKIGM